MAPRGIPPHLPRHFVPQLEMEGRQLESIQQELDVTQAKVRGGAEANMTTR